MATSQLAPTADIKSLGTILGIWAHPDDETFCSGGIMARAAENGQEVICVTATRGEKGVQNAEKWPAETLGETRTHELAKALKILGVQQHHWLNCSDGACDTADNTEVVAQLKKFITQYKPDTILTFGPDGLTGHPDHQAVSNWASEAAKGTGVKVYQAAQLRSLYEETREADEKFNIFFNVTRPILSEERDCGLVFELPKDVLTRKCQALQAMPSQYQKIHAGLGDELFQKMFSKEAFKLAGL